MFGTGLVCDALGGLMLFKFVARMLALGTSMGVHELLGGGTYGPALGAGCTCSSGRNASATACARICSS